MDELEDDQDFVSAGDDSADFAASSPKGVIKSSGTAGPSVGGERAAEAPEDEIEEHREIAYGDPHVHEALETLIDWLVGDGYNVSKRSLDTPKDTSGEESKDADEKKLRKLLKNSNFWPVFNDWVRYAVYDGHAFMELVVENEVFKPKLLPTERMKRKTDKFGNVEEYILESPGGGDDDDVSYEPHEIAELWFYKEPTEDFGRSLVEPVREQADMLRDMEIDYARFVATKAYPPILWKLGNDEERWTKDQISNWMDNVEAIEPDSMLAAPHDVETEVVGVTSTSSTAGAMRLEETFTHFQNRIVTGLGVPALLMNMGDGGSAQAEATATMPSFKRRIKRLQNIIKSRVEQQIFRSIIENSANEADFGGILPEFQFGEYSNSEKRLEVDKLLRLLNNGLLTPEAFAERAGIDPNELPDIWDDDFLTVLKSLEGTGDSIQNPDGGSPTDTEGGTESSGGEVTSRQDPGSDSSNGRNKKSVTEDEQ